MAVALAGAPLLALAADDKVPNYDAIALSPTAGWLMLAAVVGLCVFFMAHAEAFRRLLLRMDDPRPMGLFRIAFGLVTLANVNGLWEHFDYLFTDEGMFSTEAARWLRARNQFKGFGDGVISGEPYGFFDFSAFVQWLKGPNYSLLLFWDSPTFFWGHLVVWWFFMACFIFGFQTKWTKWVAWFLFHSIILRNLVFWEGTENVFRTFFFYLCLSRCGQAYSIDNWLRCRRLRKQGRLSERGEPPSEDAPKGREAIYRLIPFWPRMLTMLQIGTIYNYTGVVKNGPVWYRGDAFYYAFNLDHFYRIPPQTLSAYLGVNLFKINTHVTHYWECFFPVVILGLVIRWILREKPPDPARWRIWLGRAGLLGFASTFLAMIIWVYPVHYRRPDWGGPSIVQVQWMVGVLVPIAVAGIVLLYRRLRYSPRTVTIRGHEFTLDLDWFCRWVFGRRLWLGLGVIFHSHLILLMNIGWFSPALLCGYIAFLNGEEVARIGARFARVLARIGIPVPARVRQGKPPLPAEDPTLPRQKRDGIRLPLSAALTAVGLAVLGVIQQVRTSPDMWEAIGKVVEKASKKRVHLSDTLLAQGAQVHWGWFGLLIALMLLSVMFRRVRGWHTRAWAYPAILAVAGLGSILHANGTASMRWTGILVVAIVFIASLGKRAEEGSPLPTEHPTTGRPIMPWAYGPMGRLIVGMHFVYYVVGIGIWILPDKWCFSTFRVEARKPFTWWIQTTQTTQGWAMFAPNPPRRNLMMQVLVTDQNNETYDLNTDIYACFQEDADEALCDAVHPIPWIWYSRTGKMNRRIAGGESGKGKWYQRWHGRWVCRQWAHDHEGELPKKVEIYQVTYSIPSPEYVWKNGPYDPKTRFHEHGKREKVHTTMCLTEVGAQMSNEERARYGFEPVDEKKIRPYRRKKCKAWEKSLREKAEARGEEVDEDDPRFIRCPRDEDGKK
jgi:hypothetical protein